MAASRCSTPTRSWRPCVIGRPEMKRRRALRAIGWSVVSALYSRDTAWSQTSSPRAGSRDAFLPDRTASAPGITTRDIRIGMTAAFKGANAGLGTELYRGAQACYTEINARGGIHGRMVSVIALDDGYEPTPCIRNTIDLIEKEQVFFLSNYVGTPTLTRALPVIKRYAKFDEDMTPAVKALRQAGVDVVLCTGAYQGCGAFVRSARDAGWPVPISNVSFVGCEAMLSLLVTHGKTSGRDYTQALINSQVVPSYDDASLPAVVEYRAMMDRHAPQVPEALRDGKYAPEPHSFRSFEGFVNAKVIVEALRRAGANPTRPSFRAALESLKNVDLGIGAPLTFGPERHQGLDSVYFTRVENGRWVPVTDWSAAVKA